MSKLQITNNTASGPYNIWEDEFNFDNCTFCGHEAYAYVEDDDVRSLIMHIECSNCSASMTKYLARGSKTPPSLAKARELEAEWNKKQHGHSDGQDVQHERTLKESYRNRNDELYSKCVDLQSELTELREAKAMLDWLIKNTGWYRHTDHDEEHTYMQIKLLPKADLSCKPMLISAIKDAMEKKS